MKKWFSVYNLRICFSSFFHCNCWHEICIQFYLQNATTCAANVAQNALLHGFNHHIVLSLCFAVEIRLVIDRAACCVQNVQNLCWFKTISKIVFWIIADVICDWAKWHISLLCCSKNRKKIIFNTLFVTSGVSALLWKVK